MFIHCDKRFSTTKRKTTRQVTAPKEKIRNKKKVYHFCNLTLVLLFLVSFAALFSCFSWSSLVSCLCFFCTTFLYHHILYLFCYAFLFYFCSFLFGSSSFFGFVCIANKTIMLNEIKNYSFKLSLSFLQHIFIFTKNMIIIYM